MKRLVKDMFWMGINGVVAAMLMMLTAEMSWSQESKSETGKNEPSANQQLTVATIAVEQEGSTVNPNIYGHFAEHLGRCIYGGIWGGEDSEIPNTRGIRNDVVACLPPTR